MARIALEHVDKIYPNGFTAAKDLSLEIARRAHQNEQLAVGNLEAEILCG